MTSSSLSLYRNNNNIKKSLSFLILYPLINLSYLAGVAKIKESVVIDGKNIKTGITFERLVEENSPEVFFGYGWRVPSIKEVLKKK